jgi:hypothetical protein
MTPHPLTLIKFFCVAAATVIMGVSCAGTGLFSAKKPLEAQVLHKSAFCGTKAADQGIMWIDTNTTLKDFLQQHRTTPTPPPLPAWAQNFDFSNHRILAIFMGSRPTAGYSLEYIPGQSYAAGTTAHITIKHITPPPGAITAQVTTSPCLLIQVQKNILTCIMGSNLDQ